MKLFIFLALFAVANAAEGDYTGFACTSPAVLDDSGDCAAAACTEADDFGAASTACCKAAPAALTDCVQPDSITGYTVTETALAKASFDVTPLCAAGYGGTAAVAVCSAAGEAYTLSGCEACADGKTSTEGAAPTCENIDTCTQPADITGYVINAAAALTITGFDVTPHCAANYGGTAAVAVCVAGTNTAYTLTGCTACADGKTSTQGATPTCENVTECTQPATLPDGYTIAATGDLTADSFSVTAECAADYEGTAAAAACTPGTNTDFVLSGCTACAAGKTSLAGAAPVCVETCDAYITANTEGAAAPDASDELGAAEGGAGTISLSAAVGFLALTAGLQL